MQNRTKQKNIVEKYKTNKLSVVALIKANSLLSQNCINLSNHINKCEMDINSLYHQNLFLKNEIGDLKGIIEIFAMKMGMEKEMFDEPDNTKRKRSKEAKELKALPLHDDYTTRCPTCNTVNNKDFKACNECGYKNK